MSKFAIWIYRIKYYWLKLPIIWYRGTNKGILVITGKPDFSRPLTWVKITYYPSGKKQMVIDIVNNPIIHRARVKACTH